MQIRMPPLAICFAKNRTSAAVSSEVCLGVHPLIELNNLVGSIRVESHGTAENAPRL